MINDVDDEVRPVAAAGGGIRNPRQERGDPRIRNTTTRRSRQRERAPVMLLTGFFYECEGDSVERG